MEDRAKKKSKKRAAESVRALAKAGVGLALGPAAAVALDRLLEHGRGFVWERKLGRVKKFNREFLAGIPAGEQHALVARIESDEDARAEWARIAEQVWEDDEEEKTGIYARLLRFLLSNVSDGRTRRHLVRSVRGLAVTDIELLKTALRIGGPWPKPAARTDAAGIVYPEPPSPERDAHYREQARFLEEGDALKHSGIRRLEYSGFIKRIPAGGYEERVEVTPLGRQLLRAVESVET